MPLACLNARHHFLQKGWPQEWLDLKALDAKHGNFGERLMSAAIVKGLIEHDDGTRFLGLTMAYTFHFQNAVKRGLVTKANVVTSGGIEWYERCLKQLPLSKSDSHR